MESANSSNALVQLYLASYLKISTLNAAHLQNSLLQRNQQVSIERFIMVAQF